MSVINQGTLDATNIVVEDNIPAGLVFDSGNFTVNSAGTVATTTIPFLAASGGTVSNQICFIIQEGFMGECLFNVAEIMAQGESIADVDSAPGNDDGDQSEDDEDSAKVAVGQVFDLALVKVLAAGSPTSFNPGDIVTYDITVINQGTIDATNVVIADYIPANLIFDIANNPGWNADATFNVGTVLSGTPGNSFTVSINLEISSTFVGTSIVNDAEIISADNILNQPDVDSTPNNDATPDDLTGNDDVNDTGGGDDQDPEVIVVVCNIPPVCSVVEQLTVSLDSLGQASVDPLQLDSGCLLYTSPSPRDRG